MLGELFAPGSMGPQSPTGSSQTWRGPDRLTAILAVSILFLVFAFFVGRIEMTGAAIQENDCILGADVADYAQALHDGTYHGLKTRKHALAVVAVAVIAWPLSQLGMSLAMAGAAALALIQAIGAAAFFFFLRRNFLGAAGSAAMTLLLLTSFSVLTLFSVPETYGVTFAATAFALLACGELARFSTRAPYVAAMLAGGTGIAAGWANVPAAAFVLAYAGMAWPYLHRSIPEKLAFSVLLPGAIALAGTMVPSFIFDASTGFEWQAEYVEKYGNFAHFTDAGIMADYLAGFFIYPLLLPFDQILPRYDAADLMSMISSPAKLLAWTLAAGVIVVGVAKGLSQPDRRPVTMALLGVVGALFIFYLYFNPGEAVLYSPQWVTALVAAAGAGYRSSRILPFVAFGAAALCFTINARPMLDDAHAAARICDLQSLEGEAARQM